MGSLDLFLEGPYRRIKWRSKTPIRFAVLLNIPGITYTIGSTFQGEKENEEFIFYNLKSHVPPTQCHIYVDEKEQFWIKKGPEPARTRINDSDLNEPHLIVDKDTISFELSTVLNDSNDTNFYPIFTARLRQEETYDDENVDPATVSETEIFNDKLVIFNICQYLDIRILKRCRYLSKKWNEAAKKILEKKGTILFDFQQSYNEPKNCLRVFNYLHHIKTLRPTNLKISLPASSTKPNKPLCDFMKLLKSENNFTTLTITSQVTNAEEFAYLCNLLKTLGNKLVAVKFEESVKFLYIPDAPCEFSPKGLKKLEDFCEYVADNDKLQTWVSCVIPKIVTTLESYSCNQKTIHIFLKDILIANRVNQLAMNCAISGLDFQRVFQFEGKLKGLVLQEVIIENQDMANKITSFLEKQAKSLSTLQIGLTGGERNITVSLPPFPLLRELKLRYNPKVSIVWANCETDYKIQFPKLEILEVKTFPESDVYELSKESQLFEWEKEGSTFKSFFPDSGGNICSTTVWKLIVPSLRNLGSVSPEEYRRYYIRIFQLPEMFPEVWTQPSEGLGLTQDDEMLLSSNCENEEGEGDDDETYKYSDDESSSKSSWPRCDNWSD